MWLKESNKMQQYADIYLLLNYSTCFGRPSRPSSGKKVKVKQSRYRPGVPRGFQEVKVPRFRDNGTGWW